MSVQENSTQNPGFKKVCECGCGLKFRAARRNQKYLNHSHKCYAYEQRQREKEAQKDRDQKAKELARQTAVEKAAAARQWDPVQWNKDRQEQIRKEMTDRLRGA